MDRRRFIILGSAGSVAVLTGCGGGGGAAMPRSGTTPPPMNPPPATPASPLTAGQLLADLVKLTNTSSTPGLFAATLAAQRASKVMLPGTATEFWTYNSLVPGPLISVYEGDTIRIRLENRLSQETTVHWHGLPVPPDQYGNPMDPVAPGASRPARIDLTSRVNELEQWTIENRSSMDHPFHLHGMRFQVVSRARSGVTSNEPCLACRDTVNVEAFETVVFNVVQQQLGRRLYHCHILEHESQRMMGVLEVVA